MDSKIRKVVEADLSGLKTVLDSSGLFPSGFLDEMIADYFANPDTEDVWFTCLDNDVPIAVGYCVAEKFTQGTCNLLAIGVAKELQGSGIGGQMMTFIEQLLRSAGKRILIVETSSDDQYRLTRKFYQKLGYAHEATIRDFWKEGEDKIVFWKKL